MAKVFEEMTTKELRSVCKENGLSYNVTVNGKKRTLTKDEMVNLLYDNDAMVNLLNDNSDNATVVPVETETVAEESQPDNQIEIGDDTPLDTLIACREEIDRLIAEKRKKLQDSTVKYQNRCYQNDYPDYDPNFSMYGGVNPYTFTHTKNKEKYINEAEPGTLFAFLDENGKPRTAALVNRSSKTKKVKLVTEFGWEFVVPYDNVMWVKRQARWATNIYRILKGYDPDGKCVIDKEADGESEA